jgi:hypothetical protein
MISETTPPITDEVIVGVDHELNRSFAIGASFMWKNFHNNTWNPRGGITSANYFPVTYDIEGFGPIEIYELDQVLPGFTHYRQREDWKTIYKGVEVTMTKRLSDNWMANASINFADYREHFDSPAAYLDPTNVGEENGELILIQSGGSGRSGTYYGAARWTMKASGLYQLPYDVNLGAFFQVREGYINPQFVRSPVRPNLLGRVEAWTETVSDTKLPTYWDLDLRGEKTFDLGGYVRAHLIADIFNVFNNDIVLGRFNQVNSSLHDTIQEVMQGRVVRVGLRLVLQ